jgi:5-methyltetrahydropteroyltriglutamate--homocysteine methyltransferase
MNPPYRADHIGSFLRSSELLQARKNASREKLQVLEDQQISRILAMQKELGFELATDETIIPL